MQEATGGLQAEIFRFGALGQGGALGLGGFLGGLAPLHIGAVLAKQQINRFTSSWINPKAFRPLRLLFQQQLGVVGIEISGGEVLGQGGFDQFLFAVFPGALGLQVGAKATDAHHAGQPLQLNGAGHSGVDIPLPLGHLLL